MKVSQMRMTILKEGVLSYQSNYDRIVLAKKISIASLRKNRLLGKIQNDSSYRLMTRVKH